MIRVAVLGIPIPIGKEANGLEFRRGNHRYMQTSFHIITDQSFKTRCIVDDEFL